MNPERLCAEWVSAAESSRLVDLIVEFTDRIKGLGPLGSSENLDPQALGVRLRAARMALEGQRLRMIFARQAKYMKEGDTYRPIPPDHKLHTQLEKILADETTRCAMLLYLQDRPRRIDELADLLNLTPDHVMEHFTKLEKKGLLGSDRLIQA